MGGNSVDRVFKGRHQKEKPKFTKPKSYGEKPHKSKNNKRFQCNKCGGTPHPRHECPANAKCHSCGKKGHYQHVCCTGKAVQSIEEEEESFFLGTVTSDDHTWTVVIDVMDKNITFKLDTGADVTAVSQTEFNNIFSNSKQPVLQKETLIWARPDSSGCVGGLPDCSKGVEPSRPWRKFMWSRT